MIQACLFYMLVAMVTIAMGGVFAMVGAILWAFGYWWIDIVAVGTFGVAMWWLND